MWSSLTLWKRWCAFYPCDHNCIVFVQGWIYWNPPSSDAVQLWLPSIIMTYCKSFGVWWFSPINFSWNMILYCNNFGRFNNNYNVPEIIQILGTPKIYILSTHLQYKAKVKCWPTLSHSLSTLLVWGFITLLTIYLFACSPHPDVVTQAQLMFPPPDHENMQYHFYTTRGCWLLF